MDHEFEQLASRVSNLETQNQFNDQAFNVLREEVHSTHKKVEKIHEVIVGDGDKVGLAGKLANHEMRLETIEFRHKILLRSILTAVASTLVGLVAWALGQKG